MRRQKGLALRPTGISLLVGMIELQPGSTQNYIDALGPLLTSWSSAWRRRSCSDRQEQTSRNFDPDHFYKTCGFVGLGAWDLITLTLMSEKGLGTHLAFIGHIRGQSYFYAHDYSISLDVEQMNMDEQSAAARLIEIARLVGITDLLKAGKAIGPSLDPKYTSRTPDFRLSRRRAHWRPLQLDHINGGTSREDFWGLMEEEGKPAIKNRRKCLLGLYQLKTNQILWNQAYEWTHRLAYLTILAITWHEKSRPGLFGEYAPAVVRPLFSDGYFDLLLLIRGQYLPPMESFVQKIRYLTVQDALVACHDAGIGKLLENAPSPALLEEPLFELTHSVLGFSHSFVREIEKEHLPDLDRLDLEGLLERHPPRQLQKKMMSLHRYFRKTFADFNHPNNAPEALYKVTPSTLIAVNAGMMERAIFEISRLFSLLLYDKKRNQEGILFRIGEGAPLLYGPHDIEAFPTEARCFFGNFLADHQFLKFLMLRHTRPTQAPANSLLFQGRKMSPLLSLFSQVGPSYYRAEGIAGNLLKRKKNLKTHFDSLRNVRRLPFQAHGILTRANIEGLLNQLDTSLHGDDPKLLKCRALFMARSGFWREALSDIEEAAAQDAYAQPDILLQAYFERFLKRHFGEDITAQTLESLFTAFVAVESGLSDPLRFNLFLDVRRYLQQVFTALLTLKEVPESYEPDEHDVAISYFDPNQGQWRAKLVKWHKIARNRDSLALALEGEPDHQAFSLGPREARYFEFFDLEKRAMVRKEAGGEVCIGMEAYMLSVVDLIHRVTEQRAVGAYPYHDRSQSRIADLRTIQTKKLTAVSWMVNDMLNAIAGALKEELPGYLSRRFGPKSETIAREHLSRFEAPAQHYLACFGNTPETLVSFTDRSIQLNARQLASVGSLATLFHEIGHIIGRNISETCKSNPLEDYIWDEVAADLFLFRVCFAPLENRGAARVFNLLSRHGGRPMIRQIHFTAKDDRYDMADLFTLAWVFQLLQMPKPRNPHNFHKTLRRLCLTNLLLKAHRRPSGGLDAGPWPPTQSHDDLLASAAALFNVKIPRFMAYLRSEGADGAGGFNGDGGGDAKSHHNLTDSLWWRALVDRRPIYLSYDVQPCFQRFFAEAAATPAFGYLSFLASPIDSARPSSSPYLRPTLFRSDSPESDHPRGWMNLLEGILDETEPLRNAADYFAATAQYVGMINLGFTGNSRGRPVFSDGYVGFSTHEDQHNLARMRQIATMLLLHGGALAMRAYLPESITSAGDSGWPPEAPDADSARASDAAAS